MRQAATGFIVADQRQGMAKVGGMTASEILLIVIFTPTHHSMANRTVQIRAKLRNLTRPPALRTLDAAGNAPEQLIKRHVQGDHTIQL